MDFKELLKNKWLWITIIVIIIIILFLPIVPIRNEYLPKGVESYDYVSIIQALMNR